MKSALQAFLVVLLMLFVVAFLGFVANLLGLASFSFFAPRVEQVRYNTFKESQSYNDGMLRDLQELKMQYLQATPDQKAALSSLVLHRFSVYDVNRLPPDLQSFYYSIQGSNQ